MRQIYRIARPKDVATLFPFREMDYIFQIIKCAKFIFDLSSFIASIVTGNIIPIIINLILSYIFDIFSSFKGDYFFEYFSLINLESPEEYMYYSHIGGLYMIDDEAKKVYHCDNFFNEKRDHFICKNHNLKISSLFSDFKLYRKYFNYLWST